MLDFQTQVIALQLQREAEALQTARAVGSNTLVVCDRGVCDSHAYLTDDEFARALADNGLNEQAALARYDAVFHLQSVAKDNPSAYTKANNDARFETAEEAAAADDRGLRSWSTHPRLHIIASSPDFQAKVNHLLRSILAELRQ